MGSQGPCREFPRIYCSGYVFHMLDGSFFKRTDVEAVTIKKTQTSIRSSLYVGPREVGVKRKWPNVELDRLTDNIQEDFGVHECTDGPPPSFTGEFIVTNKCTSWDHLSEAQKHVLESIQERVTSDQKEGQPFTCVMIEGPGGCGKTRLMSQIMNHKPLDTLVLYVSKQNKRVQDFIHTDCLSAGTDKTITKPIDLTPKHWKDINTIIFNPNYVGRFALTAEKLVFALANKLPRDFHRDVTVNELGIGQDVFSERLSPAISTPTSATRTPVRKIIIMIDEYTMLQPPLVHAIAFYVRRLTPYSPLLLLMGGDKLQCGPVGWNDTIATATDTGNSGRYTTDIRHEIQSKIKYQVLDLKLENLERCRGDRALGGCVKRLRRVCEEVSGTRFPEKLINLVLTKYSVDSGVTLYKKVIELDGNVRIQKVVPADIGALDFNGYGQQVDVSEDRRSFDEYIGDLENEELDERGVALDFSLDPPINPMYDLTSLVEHFTALYVRLATVLVTDSEKTSELWPQIVCESTAAIRHLFPAFIVLRNSSCNKFAEIFLLALSTKVQELVLKASVPFGSTGPLIPKEPWQEHLKYTMRRCIRSITLNEEDPTKRQTLFVGMLYKMTSTFKTDSTCYLCNGEVVALTSLVFDNNSLDKINAVTLRKLDRDADTDLTLETGQNQNRMSENKKMDIMPFVPHISENIYQMQGNTMPSNAEAFIDLTGASSNSVYVAVSRFQRSDCIKGIIISE